MIEKFEHYFKPEVRRQGEELAEEGAVHLPIAGDARVEAFLRTGSGVRVKFTADSISSREFSATCSCPQFGRGQFCKHIWATLLKATETAPDFFDSKTDIDREEITAAPKRALNPEREAANEARKVEQKERQNEYRKAQYRLQKDRIKARNRTEPIDAGKSIASAAPPEEVANAISFFNENGFPLSVPIDQDVLKNAKRLLSRVFHPDRGGSHEEILRLNENFDKLNAFSQGPRGSRH